MPKLSFVSGQRSLRSSCSRDDASRAGHSSSRAAPDVSLTANAMHVFSPHTPHRHPVTFRLYRTIFRPSPLIEASLLPAIIQYVQGRPPRRTPRTSQSNCADRPPLAGPRLVAGVSATEYNHWCRLESTQSDRAGDHRSGRIVLTVDACVHALPSIQTQGAPHE